MKHTSPDLQPTALGTLRAAIGGAVLTAVDEGYNEARAVWNALIDRRPAVIIQAKSVSDISAGVRFAAAHEFPLSVKGGGHNVAGHAVCDGGLMIDLSGLRTVSVDPIARRARVAGGATWGDVDAATQAHGLAMPGGLISSTGVGGLTLSGGMGWLRCRDGLVIDNLLGAEVVLANGDVVNAGEPDHANLLWALKGGGGNFGIVTAFDFALHPLGPEVYFSGPVYALEDGAGPIRFWRDFMRDKTDRVGSIVEFSTIPDDPGFPEAAWGKRVFTIASLFAGDAAEGEALLQPLREQGTLVTDYSGRMNYCAVQQLFDAVIPAHEFRCYWKSLYLQDLDDETIDMIAEGNLKPPSPHTLNSIWTFGGATARVPADATAFGDRSMPYMYSVDSIWRRAEDDEANIAWSRDFWSRLRPHSHEGRAYLNFAGLGEDGETLVRRSYGATYERLRQIKRRYDPANLFKFNQNIIPAP